MNRFRNLFPPEKPKSVNTKYTILDQIVDEQINGDGPNREDYRTIHRLGSRMKAAFDLELPITMFLIGIVSDDRICRSNIYSSLGAEFKIVFSKTRIDAIPSADRWATIVQPLFVQLLFSCVFKADPTAKLNFNNTLFQSMAKRLGVFVKNDGTASYGHGKYVDFFINELNEQKRLKR